MNARDALLQIGEIRRQLARSETVHGYRSASVAPWDLDFDAKLDPTTLYRQLVSTC